MNLREIQIESFKSYRSSSLPLGPLTLMIGANASGKSNAIEAIRFLSWLASGRRLDDIMSDVQAADQLIRGSIGNLARSGSSSFRLGVVTEGEDWNHLSVEIRVDSEGMHISDERLDSADGKVPLYAVVGPAAGYSPEVQVQYNNFAPGGIKPRIPCTDQQAIFTQLSTPARFGKGHEKAQQVIPRTVGAYRDLLSRILFLDPSPRRMRQYSFKVEKGLKGDGSNLSSVLFDLCITRRMKSDVLDFVRSLPEQEIKDISFLETARNEVMVKLTESFGRQKQEWDAPNLSDGTLRVLAVAAALLSAEPDSLVIIEELDNGVHPARAGMLLDRIQRVASARGLRVLLTTHNPALLDALPFDAVPDVVFCYREPTTGESQLRQLRTLNELPDLVSSGPLGQLLTGGVIDRFVKSAKTRDERAAARLQWLEEFQETLVEE